MLADPRPVLGIDLGGTKIAAALVTRDGRLLERRQLPTGAAEGPSAVVGRLLEIARALIAGSANGISAVGIGAPGPLDAKRGLIQNPPNLPGWNDVPLTAELERGLGVPVLLDNDANLAALAEHRFGAGRGTKNLVYVTVSTGIGAGLILDGALFSGTNGNAGELGHMSVDYAGRLCNCGNRGCLEALASGTAIAARVREALVRGEGTSGLRADQPLDGAAIVAAVRAGDPLATEVWADAMLALGTGVAGIINAFNPERVVLGGGLTQAGELLFAPVRKVALARAMPAIASVVTIVPSELGGDVGVLGAAALALEGREGLRQVA